ncbi:MAG: hypothetical protein FJ096_04455 [Deltaproteobacteria bacterium]|nr:hypothetical protein [Deltaproteobacteria bacterium]
MPFAAVATLAATAAYGLDSMVRLPAMLRWLTMPLGVFACLNAAMSVALLVQHRWRERLGRLVTVCAMAWLVIGGFQLALTAITLQATNSFVLSSDRTLLALAAGALVASAAPALAWTRYVADDRSKARFPMGGLLVLLGLVVVRLGFLYVAARGHSLLVEADLTELADRLATEDPLRELPLPERGRPALLARYDAVACLRRVDELPTLLLTHLARDNDVAGVRSVCVQEPTLDALEARLRKHLARAASRGPVRIDLVGRTSELSASTLAAAWSLGDGYAGVCSEVSCLAPWQLLGLGAYEQRTEESPGFKLELGPAPDRLVPLLEPRRHGSTATRLWRIEVHSLGLFPGRRSERLPPWERWPTPPESQPR